MSVISKAINAYRYTAPNTPTYLSEMLDAQTQQLKQQAASKLANVGLSSDAAAKKMEHFLNYIYRYTLTGSNENNPFYAGHEIIYDQLVDAIGPQMLANLGFKSQHGLDEGVNFEVWLDQLIYGYETKSGAGLLSGAQRTGQISNLSVERARKSTTYTNKKGIQSTRTRAAGAGQLYADVRSNFDFNTLPDDITQEEFEQFFGYAMGEARSDKQKAETKTDEYTPNWAIQEKIDVGRYVGTLEFSTTASPELQQILSLFAHATFSVKTRREVREITLGHTNPLRVWSAISNTKTRNPIEILARWNRFLGCITGGYYANPHDHAQESLYLFYQLRFQYELTGVGQQLVLDKLYSNTLKYLSDNGADYIIIKFPTQIRVIATNTILKELTHQIVNSKLTKQSSLSDVNYVLYSIMKLRITTLDNITNLVKFQLEGE